jgi:hypothetical protein
MTLATFQIDTVKKIFLGDYLKEIPHPKFDDKIFLQAMRMTPANYKTINSTMFLGMTPGITHHLCCQLHKCCDIWENVYTGKD